MQLSDYLILAGVALLIIAALRACFKRRKKGGCSCGCCGCCGCSGCSGGSGSTGCSGCSGCSGCEGKDKK